MPRAAQAGGYGRRRCPPTCGARRPGRGELRRMVASPVSDGHRANPKKVFGIWSLGIFTFSFLANVNTTPQLATFGLGAIALIIGAIVLFLAPTAMASAELRSTFPRTGGVEMATNPGSLVPHLHGSDLAFLSGALLMFMGIEISAIHAGDIERPGRTIPWANAVAVTLCFVLFVPLALAIADAVRRRRGRLDDQRARGDVGPGVGRGAGAGSRRPVARADDRRARGRSSATRAATGEPGRNARERDRASGVGEFGSCPRVPALGFGAERVVHVRFGADQYVVTALRVDAGGRRPVASDRTARAAPVRHSRATSRPVRGVRRRYGGLPVRSDALLVSHGRRQGPAAVVLRARPDRRYRGLRVDSVGAAAVPSPVLEHPRPRDGARRIDGGRRIVTISSAWTSGDWHESLR